MTMMDTNILFQPPVKPSASMTPMLQQYCDIKKKYPGVLLLFRLGDFYELFFEDARTAAVALSIALTKRSQKGEDVPMCGIPAHASENYIARLIKQGFKVAICEQMETPEDAKKRGHKAIVERDVIRIITPGTLTEESLLESRQNNFLVALKEQKNNIGVASVDISTGELLVQSVPISALESALYRLDPKEILINTSLIKHTDLYDVFKTYKERITVQPDIRFDFKNGRTRLEKAFDVCTLEVFGEFTDTEIMASGALLEYIELTQKSSFPQLQPPKHLNQTGFLQIDAATRKNLELEYTQTGERKGSLLSIIDKTLTAGGARLLARSLAFPFVDKEKIEARLTQVEWLLHNPSLQEEVTGHLKNLPDGERILCRLSLGRGGPRDLGSIKELLNKAQQVQAILSPLRNQSPLASIIQEISTHTTLQDRLGTALREDMPLMARDGNFIAPGYLEELDTLRSLKNDSQKTMAALQTRYIQETGIQSLKIKYNNILGYYIEITAIHKERVPDHFIHRQTLSNAMRFSTSELVELQEKINTAAEKTLTLELEIFDALVQEVLSQHQTLRQTCHALSHLDMLLSLSTLAKENQYTKPIISNDTVLYIQKGRHPVVEYFLQQKNTDFIPNDCSLHSKDYMWLLTGPNMAGKSTYLRQNALILILAQMGSYVPASEAKLGIVDKVFSRVGASDDLARGRSTFMVEMIETAAILNQATPKSLVILDEIGRGTSTYDGVALAWSTAEYLHTRQKCRTLFATHYHELISLKDTLEYLSCHTVKIKEWENKVIFMHQVVPGHADKSYGIHVAELAGIPKAVIHRAKEVLSSFENEKKIMDTRNTPFVPQPVKESSVIEEKLHTIDVDTLSPKDALNLLYELKEMAENTCIPLKE